jgi:hypothetical protein
LHLDAAPVGLAAVEQVTAGIKRQLDRQTRTWLDRTPIFDRIDATFSPEMSAMPSRHAHPEASFPWSNILFSAASLWT